MQKLYCYVDETGQDTAGELFIVSVVVSQKERHALNGVLEKIEIESGKKKTKWIDTKRAFRIAYLERVLRNTLFQGKIFYSLSERTKNYREITLTTIAAVITVVKTEETYKASVLIDGLSKGEIHGVGSGLRKIGVRTRKVRGVKDENEPCIRLADAIAGLIREHKEGAPWTRPLYRLGMTQGTLQKV